jgi:hypothetical protein
MKLTYRVILRFLLEQQIHAARALPVEATGANRKFM